MSDNLQETPLAELHRRLGGKMIGFAGWNMPVQYTSIMNEHEAVRNGCGVFDISHMGQFWVKGPSALDWLNGLLTNDTRKLEPGFGQYTLMLNEAGGVIDDLIIYRVDEESVFLVVNAAKIDEDWKWLESHLIDGVSLINESDQWVGLAVQGPESQAVYQKLFDTGAELPPRNGITRVAAAGGDLIVCRTGYTGEDGYEFFCPAPQGEAWLEKFIEAGVVPCGLGARDSLRLEVCYPLNGSDLSPSHTPLQAGLGFACALDTEFVGVEVLREQKQNGLGERLVALEYVEKGAPPRPHYPVCLPGGEAISELTSGVLSPTLKKGIGMAYLPVAHAKVGHELEIEVRGKRVLAKVVKKPFYKKS